MPESKKLSELIEYLINLKIAENKEYAVGGTIKIIKNQIDQKFEELRCECGKKYFKEDVRYEILVELMDKLLELEEDEPIWYNDFANWIQKFRKQ